MKIVLGAATELELSPCLYGLGGDLRETFYFNEFEVSGIVTGVGSLATATSWLTNPKTLQADIWIMIGIAGAYDDTLSVGTVVEVISEKIGDLGIEHPDGSFESVFSAGLGNENEFPFQGGLLINSNQYTNFEKVLGVTYQMAGGHTKTIDQRVNYNGGQIESMEGAGFFYAALASQKKFCQLRAVSNKVESRDKSKWNIPLAIQSLHSAVKDLLTDGQIII